MRTYLFVLLVGWVTPGWAQELPDSGLPDGSVEEGRAEGMSEESDPQGGPCLDTKDCDQGFSCVGARCVPSKPKNLGCAAAPSALVAAGVLLALRRRRA